MVFFSEQALASATGFFRKLKSENVQLPGVVYHNMIKAFGRCGDLKTAFSLVDEMKAEKLPINEETYCHLLQVWSSYWNVRTDLLKLNAISAAGLYIGQEGWLQACSVNLAKHDEEEGDSQPLRVSPSFESN